MSPLKCSLLQSLWVICSVIFTEERVLPAAKVSPTSTRRSQSLFPVWMCIASCSWHRAVWPLQLQGCLWGWILKFSRKGALCMTTKTVLQHKFQDSLIASQTILLPPVSPLSILIHIQSPDWFSYTILSYDFNQKPPMTSPFHWRTPDILLFDVIPLPGLYHLLQIYLSPNPSLWSDWVCPSTSLIWSLWILLSALRKPLVSIRILAGSKTVTLRSLSKWRGSTEVW